MSSSTVTSSVISAPATAAPSTSPAYTQSFDVDALLRSSTPRSGRALPLVLLVIVAALIVAFDGQAGEDIAPRNALIACMISVGIVVIWRVTRSAHNHRRQQQNLNRIHELIESRQWQDAARLVHRLLSSPLILPPSRYQALIYLAAVLARGQRYGDALRVIDLVIAEGHLDPASATGMCAARTLALLREDRLVDADRALSQLKKRTGGRSVPLLLMELYRDVKTGHHEEALESFNRDLPMLQEKGGNRQADAWALAARAAQARGRLAEAVRMAREALRLGDASEIIARFPETESALRLCTESLR